MDHLIHELGASATILGRKAVHQVRESVLPRLERELRDNIVPKLEQTGEEWKERWQEQRRNSQQQRRRRRRPRPPSNTDMVYLTDRFLVSSKPAVDHSNGKVPSFLDTGRDEPARDKRKEVEAENGKQTVQTKQNHPRGKSSERGPDGIGTLEASASAHDGEHEKEQQPMANPCHSPSASSIPEEGDEEAQSAQNGKGQEIGTMSENPQDGGAELVVGEPASASKGDENLERNNGDAVGKTTDGNDDDEDAFFAASETSLPSAPSIATDFSDADGNASHSDASYLTSLDQQQQKQQEEPPTPLTNNVKRTAQLRTDLKKASSDKLMTAPSMTLLPSSSTAHEVNSSLPGIVSSGDQSSTKEMDRADAVSDDGTFHSTLEEDESQTKKISSQLRPTPSSSSTGTTLPIINSPGNMVTYLDKAHGRDNYLAVSLAKQKPDDRTMLLFRRQIVPMGIDGSNGNTKSPWSPCCVERSETPSIPHILKICYAIHAFLKLDPNNVVLTYCDNGKTRTAIVAACYLKFANMVERSEDGFRYFLTTLRRQRKLLLDREKERREKMGPILTAAMDAMMDEYDDGEYEENSSGESPEETKNSRAVVDRIIQQIPPSLKLFFQQFDRVLQLGGFLNRKPLLLRAITLQGIPVEEQPCLDIWDSSQRHVYSSHYPISKSMTDLDNSNNSKPVSQWVDEEGFYRINVVLDGEFLVLCRFGGESARLSSEQRIHDPSKILFRYTNTTGFMCGGCPYELPPQKVDLMRRYADHLNDEDFLVTLILEADWERVGDSANTGDNALPEATRERLRNSSENCGKRVWRAHEEEARDEGWKVIFENHSARPGTADINSFRKFCGSLQDMGNCPGHLITLCLQLANYDFHRTLALLWDSPVFSWWREDETTSRVRSSNDAEVPDERDEEKCDRIVENDARKKNNDATNKPFREIEEEATQNVLDILDSIDVTSTLNPSDQNYLQTFKDAQSLILPQKDERTSGGYQKSLSSLCVRDTGYLVPSMMFPRRGDISRSFHIHGESKVPEQPNDSESVLPSVVGSRTPISKPRMPYFSDNKPKLLPQPSAHVRDKDRFNSLQDHVVPTYDLKLEAAREIHSQLHHTGVTLDMLVELERVSKQWTGVSASAAKSEASQEPGAAQEIETARTKQPEEVRGESTMNREERERKEKEWKDAQKTEAEERLKESKENKTSREKEKEAVQDAERKRIEEAMGEEESLEEVPLNDDPEYAKYFKMLRMGLAREQVVHAMQRDEKDPKILDLDPTKSLESQLPDTEHVEDDNVSLKDHPVYSKYFKMIKMGMSREQVSHALKRDEKDPRILDMDPNKSLESQLPENNDCDDAEPPLKDDPEYAKYFKMMKMGMPKEQVLHALQRDEKDTRIIDLDPNKSLKSQQSQDAEVDDGPPLKDDPEYAKYFKMMKMGMPKEQVLHALQRDEKDPKIIDLDPNKSLKSQQSQAAEVDNGPPLKDDPEYAKYFKMEKMGLPKDAVRNALVRDGKNPAIIDLDPTKSLTSQLGGDALEEKDIGTPLKDDPEYAKYFKMEKMGLPRDAIRNALVRDGKDPAIIDFDPSLSVEYQLKKSKSVSAADKAIVKKKKKKVRRKKIYWNPIDPSKLKKDSLWNIVRDNVLMGNLDYDQKEFEELFTESAEAGAQKKTAKPAEKAEKKSVQAIDPKRSMNGGIVLSRIKTDWKSIAEYVDKMEHNKFDATQLKNLKEYLATADERRALAAYMNKGANAEEEKKELYNALSETEKYMVTLMEVSNAEAKLHTMEFRTVFKNRFIEMTESVRTLDTACDQLRTSEKFRKLMAIILTVVNEINTGGEGNLAIGFTLDALLKLNEAKAFDKKTSVLHYVVKLVKKNDESLLAFENDLSHVLPAESVLLDTVVGDLKAIREELADVIKIVAKQAEELEKAGKIPKPTLAEIMEQKSIVQQVGGVLQFNKITHLTGRTSMERFSMNAKVACEQAIERVANVKSKYLLVLDYFGEDESMSTGDFFGILRRFMTEWKKAIGQVEKIERLQATERKREARRAAKEKKAKEKKVKDKKAKGSALKKTQNDQSTEPTIKPTVGGIAALAAEAALKKSKQAPPTGGIAALTAEAALKKCKQGPPAGGIAALAAKAALKKSSEAKDSPPAGGIAALAAEAALKKSTVQKSNRGGDLNFSNHAIAPDGASRVTREGKVAVALKKSLKKSNDAKEPAALTTSEEGKQRTSPGGVAALAAAGAMKKSEKSVEKDDSVRVSPKLGIAEQASHDGLKTSLRSLFQNQTPQEMRSEILRQNHDDSSVAVMAEDLAKEPMGSSDANTWEEEGGGISDYIFWANQAIKASDTESVRDFQASKNIVEHYEYDDESTIATNFDDDASISTALTNSRIFTEEGSNYYSPEQYIDQSGATDDPYNPMAVNTTHDPYGNGVINMSLNFNQDQGVDAGLSFGGEEGFDGPGEYGSNEMMHAGYDDTGLGGFGHDAGLGGFGLASPTLKRKFQNDFSSPQIPPASGATSDDLSQPWGGKQNKRASFNGDDVSRPWGGQQNKRASFSGGDDVSRPWGGQQNKRASFSGGDDVSRPWGAENSTSNTSGVKDDVVFRGWGESSIRSHETEQPKAKKWFWQSGG